MIKRISLILIIVATLVVSAVIVKVKLFPNLKLPTDNKLSIATSFYPLYYIAQQIGQDQVHVTNITPAGAEPHEYEPTTRDLVNISHADLVIVNGVGLEPWTSKVTNPNILSVSDQIADMKITEDGEQIVDPHTWLDPVLMQEMVKIITAHMIEKKPENTEYFSRNEQALLLRLENLDQQFKQMLSACKLHSVVTSHEAFGYLARRYRFTQIAIAGISPEIEPSAKKMAELTTLVQKNKIPFVFFETLVSPRLADTIAAEAGVRTLVFNPLEGLTPEEEKSEDYFTIQAKNLQNLKMALSCM